jgi:DeoR family glycerol-3-phosphate regulon repressor
MANMTNERQFLIIEIIRAHGSLSFEDLATHLGVAPQTAHRLAHRLCEQGLLRAIPGGVALAEQNLAYENRKSLNLPAKRRIARAVAAIIADGASVMIGSGTTPECVALALAQRTSLRIITGSLNAAAAFARNPSIEIAIASGTLRPYDRDIIGESAVRFFGCYKADYGVFGVGGIDEDGSLRDFQDGERQARLAIAANCRTTMLVADASKFGRSATVRGGHFGDCHHIFTDQLPPADFRELVGRYAGELHIADERDGRPA